MAPATVRRERRFLHAFSCCVADHWVFDCALCHLFRLSRPGLSCQKIYRTWGRLETNSNGSETNYVSRQPFSLDYSMDALKAYGIVVMFLERARGMRLSMGQHVPSP
uniref:Uncharacterized protein n=1 Tax=Noctiluca scintillans TaxID=2966 RepID=A0A7S1F1E8_NOCSC|mmetsp:Transcript_24244/g.63610  ORF Transcript_24244/g.63610 Transcript_24244/m.63610 type:complete len:107 (+) Transcript_24244:26-346(+)